MYEQLWFYEGTFKLDVPMYTVIGNHESFSECDAEAGQTAPSQVQHARQNPI